MKTLTQEQADALLAFIESFELNTTGQWAAIEEAMREDWGIADPETALEAARDALR